MSERSSRPGASVPVPDSNREWLHFAGVAGSGMSALAQYHALRGGRATGSDRYFDRGEHPQIRTRLESVGIEILPQDGTAFDASCDALVVSTAVEDTVPDVRKAKKLGIPILHRSELLARYVRESQCIAVTGTSGKSTVVAMLFEILEGAGLDPSVLTGGELVKLRERGLFGNAYAGSGPHLVIEADESDGSLIRYHAWAGVLLNLQRDHKEPEELAAGFRQFRENTSGPFLVGPDPNLDEFAAGAERFGMSPKFDTSAEDITLEPTESHFNIGDVRFHLPAPGLHNVFNATAAVAAATAAGVDLEAAAEALREFHGVSRRFQSVGQCCGIEVIDDFGHNPEKIRASLQAAQLRGGRVLAVFQPHGFGPTRFIRKELVASVSKTLRPTDIFWMLEIFYAGGTADRDLSSAEIVADLVEQGAPARFAKDRDTLVREIRAAATDGDLVLVMGARDPSLTELARELLRSLDVGLSQS